MELPSLEVFKERWDVAFSAMVGLAWWCWAMLDCMISEVLSYLTDTVIL